MRCEFLGNLKPNKMECEMKRGRDERNMKNTNNNNNNNNKSSNSEETREFYWLSWIVSIESLLPCDIFYSMLYICTVCVYSSYQSQMQFALQQASKRASKQWSCSKTHFRCLFRSSFIRLNTPVYFFIFSPLSFNSTAFFLLFEFVWLCCV